ncbi:MAG: anti-sigma factor [Acidimicrobiia bacterium]
MGSDDIRPDYLATGSGDSAADHEQLDLIRGVLAEASTWAEPPEGVVEGVLDTIAREGQIPAVEPVAASSRRRPWLVAAGAVAAIFLLVFGIVSFFDEPIAETVVAMTGTELAPSAAGIASLRPTSSGWYIRLDVSGLPAAPEGSYYEGWVWSDDEGVSIGTFHLRNGADPVVLWSGVNVAEYPAIWVTLEDEGAGPEASDRIMMKGRVDELIEG